MAIVRHITRIDRKGTDGNGVRHFGRRHCPTTLPLIRRCTERLSRHVTGRQRGWHSEFEHAGLILHRLLILQLHRYRLPRGNVGHPCGKQIRPLLLDIRRVLPGLFCFLIGPARRLLRLHLAFDRPLAHFHGQSIHTGLFRQREHKHALPPPVAGVSKTPQQPGVGNQTADAHIEIALQNQGRLLPLTLAVNEMKLANVVGLIRLGIEWVDKQHQHHGEPEADALQAAL